MHSTGFKFACLVVRFFVLMAYLFAGAAVFRTLEKGESDDIFKSKPEIEQYLDWLHFTFSCTTTIGYGDIYPKSNAGKIFFIFYALIGIPMMVWYLALSGEIQTRIYRAMLSSLRTKFWKKDDRAYKDIAPVIISSLVFIIFWLIGAALSRHILNMTIVNSLYYWFGTFSTTGFGDIVLSMKGKGTSKFFLWLIFKLFGFNLVAGVIHSVMVWINGFDEKKELFCCSCFDEEAIEDPGPERYNVAFATRLETTSVPVKTENRVFMGN